MKGDQRSRLSIWTDAIRRAYMWQYYSEKGNLILITEYPKSGGSWVGQMISEYTQLPFPRNCTPAFEPCILHGHRLYSSSFKNTICVLRDGRDIMVSAYYHYLFLNDKNNHAFVKGIRKKLGFKDIEDIETNLHLFIEYLFTKKTNLIYNFTWADFVRSWHNKDVAFVKYENLLEDPLNELSGALFKTINKEVDKNHLTKAIEKFSFVKLAKRDSGEENINSFVRKGIAGDWKNKFNQNAKNTFNYYGGKELILLGYEKNEDWVHSKIN